MKVQTDFGIQEIKPQKIFEWEGIKFAIVKRPEAVYNTKGELMNTSVSQKVVEYSTSHYMPLNIQRGDTLKTIQEKAITALKQKGSPEKLKQRIQTEFEILNP